MYKQATTAGAGVPIAAASFSPATQPAVGGGIPGGYNVIESRTLIIKQWTGKCNSNMKQGGSNIGIIPARAPTYAPAFAPSASAFYQGGGGGGLVKGLSIINQCNLLSWIINFDFLFYRRVNLALAQPSDTDTVQFVNISIFKSISIVYLFPKIVYFQEEEEEEEAMVHIIILITVRLGHQTMASD